MSHAPTSLIETPSGASGSPSLAARLLGRKLPQPLCGRLRVSLPNSDVVERAGAASGPEAEIAVGTWSALPRLLIDGEHGLAEGFIRGEWATPDLVALLDFFARNEARFGAAGRSSLLTSLRNIVFHRRRANTRAGSRRNVSAHYDLGNAFYRAWLDAGMSYSSAIFTADESLEAAQEAKLDRVVSMLDLSGGETVLEIGCGWGALAERIVERQDTRYVGITLSREQLDYARERLAAVAPAGRPDLRLQDYRDLDGSFDRIVSIEMMEAVGERYWPGFFDTLRQRLRPDGVAVLQVITIEQSRFETYRRRPDFIQRHIFPGGMLPAVAHIESLASAADMELVETRHFGESYARTVAEWRRRFQRAWPSIEPLGFDDRFRRMWDYYLAYCEVGFRAGAIDVGLYKLVRKG